MNVFKNYLRISVFVFNLNTLGGSLDPSNSKVSSESSKISEQCKIQDYETKEQGCNARKVNCSCVYSAYTLKPVLSGRNL